MQIGSQIGPYRVESLLGRGGMAEVFKVWHQDLQRHEAMKVLPHALTFDRSFVERFLREARTAAGMQHPNIAAIHSVSETDAPQPYFTMELINGGDLADLIAQRGRFTLDEALPILRQIAAALDYARARGLIHRDIKPANIMLGADGDSVKVVDFGIARAQEEVGGTRMTKTGMIVGTPEYMSPEQAGSGAPVGARTDQYSLGIIAYEMLCGAPPFRAHSESGIISVLMAHVRDTPRPLIELVPDLPRATDSAILRALAKNPDQRFASCGEFTGALEGAVRVQPKKRAATSASNNLTLKRVPLIPVALGALALAGVAFAAVNAYKAPQVIEVVAPVSDNTGGTATALDTKKNVPEVATGESLFVADTAAVPVAPVSIAVPALVGKNSTQAQEIIKASSLTAEVKTGDSNAFEAQQVMGQWPAPGSNVAPGTPITIRVSLGAKSVPVSGENQTFKTYSNARFNYSIDYPDSLLIPQNESANSDGQTFQSADAQALLLVSGSYNALDETIESRFRKELAAAEQDGTRAITYQRQKSNWYVTSGDEGINTFYQKTMLKNGVFIEFRLTHPKAAEKSFDPVTTRISRSFRFE